MVVANEFERPGAPNESCVTQQRATLGALINIAGRQRMLSHRAVMFLALSRSAASGDAGDLLRQAGEALRAYRAGVHLLLNGDAQQAIPPLCSERAKAILAKPTARAISGAAALEGFGSRGEACLAGFARDDRGMEAEIRALAQIAGDVLLPLLNAIVAAFEQDLADASAAEAARAADVRVVMTSALDDIEQTATRIRLIAFNALIEAARAGDSGRAFSVIAEEIRMLGTQTRQESEKMQAAIARLFAA